MTKENKSATTMECDLTIDTSKAESPAADIDEKTIRDRVVQRIEGLPATDKSPRAIINNPKIYSGKGMGRRACRISEERPSEIKRYHVEELIQSFAMASNRETQEVRRQVYGVFNKRAVLKGFNIFVEAKRQKVAIIEAIRRRDLMDKLYDIVIRCIEDYNKSIPEKPHNDGSIPPNSGSFTGKNWV